jgi:hypothetical protein
MTLPSPCSDRDYKREGASAGASVGAVLGSPLGPVGAGVGAGFGGAAGFFVGYGVTGVDPSASHAVEGADAHVDDDHGDHDGPITISVTDDADG